MQEYVSNEVDTRSKWGHRMANTNQKRQSLSSRAGKLQRAVGLSAVVVVLQRA